MTTKQKFPSKEMEPEVDPRIEKAAEEYVEVRDARITLQEDESGKQATLLALMLEKKLKSYKFDGKLITIEEVQKAKVKKIDE